MPTTYFLLLTIFLILKNVFVQFLPKEPNFLETRCDEKSLFLTDKIIFAKVWQRIIVTKSRLPKTCLNQKTHAGTCVGDKSQKCEMGYFVAFMKTIENRNQVQSISSKLNNVNASLLYILHILY